MSLRSSRAKSISLETKKTVERNDLSLEQNWADAVNAEENKALAAKVLKFADLVSYQGGSVVSRVVLRQKGGNVTVFAFDAGQELSEHTAPFDALVNVMEGEVEVTISGTPIRVGAGESVIMPANQPHALKAISRSKMVLTMIRG
jgi:quercetin dioxygenase-like cupin family protein